MFYVVDTELEENSDISENRRLILDGTANLDYFDDEKTPRDKGLIELLSQFLSGK